VSTVERERKFLVNETPVLDDEGERLRQGYLTAETVDPVVAVRIRETPTGRRLTVKGGLGATRTEVEVPIDAEQFEALWPLTSGRRIDKVRYRIPLGSAVAELDRFGGDLDGLWLVEVEFDDQASMAAFEPPDWFGGEVTDDPAYTNLALSIHGRP